jgi:hypothetical protein
LSLYLIGQFLESVVIKENLKLSHDSEICLDVVRLNFQTGAIALTPKPETDELEFSMRLYSSGLQNLESIANIDSPKDCPHWCKPFIGKKLQTIWQFQNSQGYTDQIIFAFERLRPSLIFLCESSVINVFTVESIKHHLVG